MSNPYEVLFRFKPDGSFSGGHTIRFAANGQLSEALPLGVDTAFPWPIVAGEINTAALARIATLEAELAAKDAESKTALDAQSATAQAVLVATEEALQAALADAVSARAEFEGNKAYQLDVLSQASIKIPAAIESGDWTPVMALLAYAGADFAEKERLAKLAKAQELKQQAADLEAEAQLPN